MTHALSAIPSCAEGTYSVGVMKTKRSHNSGIPASSTAPAAAFVAEQTQISKYYNQKSGHGFAAEDANHLADLFAGKPASVVGRSNKLNGADRLVGATALQSKYYRTAQQTLAAAFDGPSGNYRYTGQLLEVPKDQHAEVVRLMRGKISAGRVPGVTDPAKAPELVRQGSITYGQARNTARAGNIESIIFDAKTQSVTAACTFGMSFAVTFAMATLNGKSYRDAVREASLAAVQVGGTAFLTGILASQFLRTRSAAVSAVAIRSLLKKVPCDSLGRKILEALACGAAGQPLAGAAAINHLAKALRSNILTAAIATAVTSTPDFYRAFFARTISRKQLIKNVAVNAAGAAGGTAGWFAGAAGGAAIGTAVAPGVGTTVGAVLGGIAGAFGMGAGCAIGTKRVADILIEDDAEAMISLLRRRLAKIAESYLLTPREVELLGKEANRRADAKWLRELFRENSASRRRANKFILDEFTPFVERMLRRRPKLRLPGKEKIIRVAVDSVLKAVDEREAHAA
jgi:outer membrane lipoprotein SlyB